MYLPENWIVQRQIKDGWELTNARAGVTFLVMWAPALGDLLKVHSNTGSDVIVRKSTGACGCKDTENGAKAAGRLCKHAAAVTALRAHLRRMREARELENATTNAAKRVATLLSEAEYNSDVQGCEDRLGSLAASIQADPTGFSMLLVEQLRLESQYFGASWTQDEREAA